ncbi:16357_t:CDS:2, partial [Rhizophagus irregularis]
LYKKIDELKKETSQKTSKEESKESKESKESLELLERLLKELRQISKVLILNDHIKSREKNNYNKEEVEKKLLKVFIEELSNTFEEFETENVKEFNDIISEVLKKFIKNKLSNYKVEEEFSKILNNYNDFKTEKAIKFIEEISKKSDNSEIKIEKLYIEEPELSKNSDNSEIKIEKLYIEEPELSKNSDNSEIKIEKLYEIIDELKKELSKIHDENHFKTSKAKKIIDKFSKHHDNYPNIEKLYEKIDGLKKETCQITSREESKELKELLERLLKELHQISKEFILKEFIKLRDDHNYTKLHEWLNEGLKLSNTLGNVKEFNDKISEVIENKLSNYKVKENLFEENDETSQKELLKKWYPNELHQISKELILKEFIKLRDDHNYSKLHKGLNELEKLQKLLNKDDEEIDYSKLHKELLKSMEINNEEIDNKDIDKIEKKLLKVFIEELSNTGNVKEFNNIISEVLIKFIDNELSSFMKKIKIEKLFENFDELKKETSQKTSREESQESKELKELLERLLKELDPKELHQISKGLILRKFIELRRYNYYTKLHKGLNELNYFTEFEKLHKLFKEINQKTFHSINLNYSTHLVKDEYFFKHLYYEIVDSIKEVEDDVKLNPVKSYIDFGKHFGTHLFQNFIPDGKRKSDKVVNQKLIRCYYRLGELLFSDNDGENAPKKVTDLQHRKAKNVYDLYNKMLFLLNDINVNNNVNKLPINMIKGIKSQYATTIFAISNDDVTYLTRNTRNIRSKILYVLSNYYVNYLTRDIRSKINDDVKKETENQSSDVKKTKNQISDVKETENQSSDDYEKSDYYDKSDDYEKSNDYIMQIHLDGNKEGEQ